MKMKRIVIILCILIAILSTNVYADGTDESETDFGQGSVYEGLPEEMREYIPSDFFTGGVSGLSEKLSIGFFLRAAGKMLSSSFPRAVKSFSFLLGILVISSVLGALGDSIASPSVKSVFSYISSVCICAAVYEATGSLFSLTKDFILGLSGFVTKLMPVMTALLYASGKVSTAAVSGGIITAALAILENICAGVLFPLIQMCFAISAGGAMCGNAGLSGITATVKKTVTYLLSFIMLLLSLTLAFQSVITKSADSLALKGVKFAVGSFIPIVGGAINEALTAITGSIGTIRSAVGIAGAAAGLFMTVSPIIYILLNKALLELSASFAVMLGLERESRFLSDTAGIAGFFVSLSAVTGVFFIFSLSVLAGIS